MQVVEAGGSGPQLDPQPRLNLLGALFTEPGGRDSHQDPMPHK